mmetsp:Transcript_26106/g.56077  ORF Transcript_26106/g.56077 Transcript_26106/m.56077 type:complete len:141 (-) Transcript_26106:508-930(-)
MLSLLSLHANLYTACSFTEMVQWVTRPVRGTSLVVVVGFIPFHHLPSPPAPPPMVVYTCHCHHHPRHARRRRGGRCSPNIILGSASVVVIRCIHNERGVIRVSVRKVQVSMDNDDIMLTIVHHILLPTSGVAVCLLYSTR